MNITQHFAWSEFQGGSGLKMKDASPETLEEVKLMAGNLEIAREEAGKPIRIVGGIRTAKSSEAIRKAGGRPSKTSDHFYGENPDVPLAVGAVDARFGGGGTKKQRAVELFNTILKLKYEGRIRTGQVLLEHDPATGSWWTHVANDPRLVLSPEDLAKRSDSNINLVAYSLDNGKSFTMIPWGQYFKSP
ncbi:MAG: hypothetical protein FWC26_00515 [Fibromonadales bacterium]|nr:hypothetical protein [Fibromonadales bacterium]